jgi:hypothetical protein
VTSERRVGVQAADEYLRWSKATYYRVGYFIGLASGLSIWWWCAYILPHIHVSFTP